MSGTPREYITLRHTETDRNFSQYTAGGASPGTDVRTTFTRVRLDPAKLVVDVGDLTFATSTGRLQHSAVTRGPSSPFVTSMPFAMAETCTPGRPTGVGNVDFRGTPYAGADPVETFSGSGSATKSTGDQVVDLSISGYCGWVAPDPSWDNPINPQPGNFRLELKCAPSDADTGGGSCQEGQVLPTSSTSSTSSTTTSGTATSSTTATTTAPPAPAPPARDTGYWLVGRDGKVYAFGDAGQPGGADGKLPAGADAVDIEATPTRNGFWILSNRGQVYASGDAAVLPSLGSGDLGAGESAVSLAATPSGAGYWILTSAGRVHAFGDARFFGDLTGRRLNAPITAGVAAPTGGGYYLAAADGGVFGFDAPFRGAVPPGRLNGPVVAAATYGDGCPRRLRRRRVRLQRPPLPRLTGRPPAAGTHHRAGVPLTPESDQAENRSPAPVPGP
jgi:hypothetical protein